MRVHDLVTPFTKFASSVDGPPDEAVARWRSEIVEPHAGLFEAIEPWVNPDRAADRLPGLIDRHGDFEARAQRAVHAVEKAYTLLPDPSPFETVVMVGLGGANGWAATVEGRETLFLGVESLPEPGYDVVLALHEMIHVQHLARGDRGWPDEQVGANLFREGLATYATTRLLPEVDASGHLWFAPGREPWIDRCAALEPELRRRIMAELDGDDVDGRWFRGLPDRPGEFPGRCGYWLGLRLMEHVLDGIALETAMQWPLDEATHRMKSA